MLRAQSDWTNIAKGKGEKSTWNHSFVSISIEDERGTFHHQLRSSEEATCVHLCVHVHCTYWGLLNYNYKRAHPGLGSPTRSASSSLFGNGKRLVLIPICLPSTEPSERCSKYALYVQLCMSLSDGQIRTLIDQRTWMVRGPFG